MQDIMNGVEETEEEDSPPAGTLFQIYPLDDDAPDLSKANVSDVWGPEFEKTLCKVIENHPKLFAKEMGMFNDGIVMPIPFKRDVDLRKLKRPPYNLSLRDQKAIDEVVDPLRRQGRVKRVPLGQPSTAASPAFVVWRLNKPRVVVDLRLVNAAVFPDVYPLPKQDTILQALGGGTVFSSLDIVKSFFQQPIAEEDQWKTAFVTPHRGQEMLTVATMGLINSPGFFQHRMELLLQEYLWKFVLVYIDDVIIFSRNLSDHIRDVGVVLDTMEQAGITLSLAKCHFGYLSINALGHQVNRLGLATAEDKVKAIRLMEFPDNLKQLEYVIGFFGYYRKFVWFFAAVIEPLQILKTKGFKPAPQKGKPREMYAVKASLNTYATPAEIEKGREAFEALKKTLCAAPVLVYPDFTRPFIFYVDGSKERGYGCAVHQLDVADPPKERPILFLSKALTEAEKRYWPTELETGALVWALQKLPQYTDQEKLTIWCDHEAILASFKDTSPLQGRRSDRLNRWRLFLAKYLGKAIVKHKPGKDHKNADGLSRIKAKPPQTGLMAAVKTLFEYPVPTPQKQQVLVTTRKQARETATASREETATAALPREEATAPEEADAAPDDAEWATSHLHFIVSLPLSRNECDAILTVTDKFTKHVTLIPGKTTWEVYDWAIAYYDKVFAKYGLPAKLILDRDPKFISAFWTALFKRSKLDLAMTAAYHPAANGQSERTNQIVETMLRCLIAHRTELATSDWDDILPEVEYTMNTLTNASTGYSPFYLLYGVHLRDDVAQEVSYEGRAREGDRGIQTVDDFTVYRQQIRKDAADALKLAQASRNTHAGRAPPPPPVIIDGEQRWIVDRIVRKEQRRQKRDKQRRPYYRVRWQGFGPEDDTWVEEQELREQIPEIVDAFETRFRRRQ
ncbi:hypothetical protein DV736_g6568, partial [Chaetothyriales sp. CBS 134916]